MSIQQFHFRALLLLTCSLQPLTEGAEFLGRKKTHPPPVRQDLFASIHELTSARHGFNFTEVNEAVEMTYETLPKTENGRLDRASLFYLAHSFFMKERNWFISGLNPLHQKTLKRGELPVEQDYLFPAVESLLFQHASEDGYRLSDAVTFVAMLGNAILREDVEKLENAYAASHLTSNSSLNAFQVSSVLQKWGDTPVMQSLSSDIVQNFAFAHASTANPFKETTYNYSAVTEMTEIAGKQYSDVWNLHCKELKNGLVELDSSGTGRVPLGRFFRQGAIGEWSLTESPEYLRHIGVLDESAGMLGPQVIIANYVAAPQNCEKLSGYHSHCCVHECEELLSKVNANFESSTADPMDMASIISQMSSTTVQAPRELSPALMGTLKRVAEAHGGQIHLHGRLFAQWMHYAFPYECPYVYMSKRMKPLVRSYRGHSDRNVSEASEDEMMKYIQGEQSDATEVDGFYMSQWTDEEEMRTGVQLNPAEQRKGFLSSIKPVIAVCPACCIIIWMWRAVMRFSEPHGKPVKPVKPASPV